MFAGLMRLECPTSTYTDSCAQHQSAQSMEKGGSATPSAGSSSRKRIHRRPGYMRRDLPRLQGTSAGGEGRASCLTNGVPGCPGNEGPKDISEPVGALRDGVATAGTGPSAKRPQSDQDKLRAHYQLNGRYLSSSPPPLSRVNCSVFTSPCSSQIDPKPTTDSRPPPDPPRCPSEAVLRPTGGSFSSSFSFIQQSLSSSQTADEPHSVPEPSLKTFPPSPVCGSSSLLGPDLGSADCSFSKPSSSQSTPAIQPPGQSVPKRVLPLIQSESVSTAINQSKKVQEQSPGEAFWQVRPWGGREVVSDLANGDLYSLDTEATSSLSVDSDAASASSVTSGYESATPTCDQGWDRLVKKYEGILQDCLQNNRANAKIESMMLKLQRLQQKAILDDDYDTAERFGKKLEELRTERGSLSLGLPSRQPSVALFLQRLRKALHSALQRTDDKLHKDGPEVGVAEGVYTGPAQSSVHRRDRLIQEKQLAESEMAELQRRLLELQELRQSLEQRIQQEEQDVEAEEVGGAALRTCSPAQLRDMSRALEDLVDSQHRTQMSVSPSLSILRLQEKEQALSLSIKEATAKVVMSQRLGGSLRRKVSETETQLLALHEAKLAAISGNDFGSAKELKAEMRAVYVERDRLDSLAKRLHSLSSSNSHELARMKEQQQQIKRQLEQREAQHENTLREDAVKYVELLEDRLPCCSCPALERVWEADLEACHLFLRGLQLRTPSCSGPKVEDLPTPVVQPHCQPCTKEKEDCAMLTALGGRWCPEANLQNSEFTKKLEEFLFCMEDNHPEDECREAEAGAEAADLTEQCELISDRLMTLEDNLQTAILNRDLALTQSLEAEVREVKATLQTMLAQLVEEEEEEDDEDRDDDVMEGEIEEGEGEGEDQYFSDSWDI